MSDDSWFAQVASTACHDMRTPLATVYGFARTLAKLELPEPADKYVAMVEAAAAQVGDLLEQFAIVSRIEAGRYDPPRDEADSLTLAAAAARELGEGRVRLTGEGATVRVPVKETERALVNLARAAQRHGGLEAVELAVRGAELRLGPVERNAAGVLTGEVVRELGAAAAVTLVRALGGSVELAGDVLRIRLPA
jgi:signal transduction histidine kinase